jgi:probable HAF family extracellular repeat protein
MRGLIVCTDFQQEVVMKTSLRVIAGPILVVIITLLSVGPGWAAEEDYRMEVLPLPPAMHYSGQALKINEAGEIVGFIADTTGTTHAALWRPHGKKGYKVLDLGTPGDTYSFSAAYVINEDGDVVGEARDESGSQFAFFWRHGKKMISLPAPGGQSIAQDINDRDEIVGFAQPDPEHAAQPVVWRDGSPYFLESLVGQESGQAVDINNQGFIVGIVFLGSAPPAAVAWSGDAIAELGIATGQGGSGAYSVNENQQVAGVYFTPGGAVRGFYWDRGVLADIDVLPEHSGSCAYGVNDYGQVVGWSQAASPNDQVKPIIWQDGVMTALPLEGRVGGIAYSINNAGTIVGVSNSPGPELPVVWKKVQSQ